MRTATSSNLEDGKVRIGERIPGGYVFVEGSTIGEADPALMREREQLAQSGIFVVNLSIDKKSNRLLVILRSSPTALSRPMRK